MRVRLRVALRLRPKGDQGVGMRKGDWGSGESGAGGLRTEVPVKGEGVNCVTLSREI